MFCTQPRNYGTAMEGGSESSICGNYASEKGWKVQTEIIIFNNKRTKQVNVWLAIRKGAY